MTHERKNLMTGHEALQRLRDDAPALAVVESVTFEEIHPAGGAGFVGAAHCRSADSESGGNDYSGFDCGKGNRACG